VFARKVIRIFGDTTKEEIENETRAISTLCNGECRYVVEVLQHGWLVDESLYFIDMEYCQATLEDFIKILHMDVIAQTDQSPESELPFHGNPTTPLEEVSTSFATKNNLLTRSLRKFRMTSGAR
jgi:hypothetical protein